MYYISSYSYDTKKHEMVASGSRNNITEHIETFILNYIDKMQGFKYNKFGECIKKSGETLSAKEWNKDIRYFVTRSNNNMSKYVIRHMTKVKGYMYNSYETKKVKTVYLIKNNKYKKKIEERRTSDFDFNKEFNSVIDELVSGAKDKKSVKVVDVCKIYKSVISELKEKI